MLLHCHHKVRKFKFSNENPNQINGGQCYTSFKPKFGLDTKLTERYACYTFRCDSRSYPLIASILIKYLLPSMVTKSHILYISLIVQK